MGVDPLRRLHLDDESRSEGATTPTLPTRSSSDEAAFVNAVRREVGERSQGARRRGAVDWWSVRSKVHAVFRLPLTVRSPTTYRLQRERRR